MEKKEAVISRKPSIILFLVDDKGRQDTSLPFWNQETLLNRKFYTLNMEWRATDGMKFTQANACSVCSPTRVSLMNGMNATWHGVNDWILLRSETYHLKDDLLEFPDWICNGVQPEGVGSIERSVSATTLAQILQEKGYFTIHCGKANLGVEGTPGSKSTQFGLYL